MRQGRDREKGLVSSEADLPTGKAQAVALGREAGGLPEDLAEIAETVEAAGSRNLPQAGIRLLHQQHLGPVDADTPQIAGDRLSGGRFKKTAEVLRRAPEMRGQLVQGNILRIMILQIEDHLFFQARGLRVSAVRKPGEGLGKIQKQGIELLGAQESGIAPLPAAEAAPGLL